MGAPRALHVNRPHDPQDIFRDARFKHAHCVGTINSVNIARVLVQVVHYFYAYLRLNRTVADDIDVAFSVPTGAAGHVSAGVIATKMGLPVTRLCAATNANDVLHRMLSAPAGFPVDISVGGPVRQTTSPSMDILIPYNLEVRVCEASEADRTSLLQGASDWL